MAYPNSNGGNRPQQSGSRPAFTNSAVKTGTPGTTERKPAIFQTGLFKPTKEGVKSIGSVQVKEDVTIPAGSYINLYTAASDKNADLAFKIQVTPGVVRAAGSNNSYSARK